MYNTQHTQEKNIHAFGRLRTRNPSMRAATALPIRPGGHRDRLKIFNLLIQDNRYELEFSDGMCTGVI